MQKFKTLLTIFILLIVTSCLKQGIQIDLAEGPSSSQGGGTSSVAVSSFTLQADGQLLLAGSNLLSVNSVKVTSGTHVNESLKIEAQSDSALSLSGLSQIISMVANGVIDIIVSDANGVVTYPITIQNGTITGTMLSNMGGTNGQVLKLVGGVWTPSDLNSLVYAGTWDASSAIEPNASPLGGEYYIVSVSAVGIDLGDGSGLRDWNLGDWIVYNSTTTKWDKIDNSTLVQSFNSRTGAITPQANDYTWAQIDKTVSSLNDIADVDTAGVASGKILKWDGAKWAISDDLNSGGAGSVTTTEIQDGTIVDADISATADIAQSKILNLTTDLAAKLPLAGGTMTGDIVFSGTQTFDGVDVSALNTQVTTNTTAISGKESSVTAGTAAQYYRGDKTWQTLDTSVVPENGNLYYTDVRARAGVVSDSIVDMVVNIAPSQNAVFDALALKANSSSLSNYVLKAGDTMSGALAMGANKITGMADPTLAQDAATKAYVDAQVSGAGDDLGNHTATQNIDLSTFKLVGNGGTAGIAIDATGNVGIGTTSPSSKLEVTSSDYVMHLGEGTGGAGIDFKNRLTSIPTTGTVATIGWLESTSGLPAGSLLLASRPSVGGVAISGNGEADLYVSPSGKVGIGTTTPSHKLNIEGDLHVSNSGLVLPAPSSSATVSQASLNLTLSPTSDYTVAAGGFQFVLGQRNQYLIDSGTTATDLSRLYFTGVNNSLTYSASAPTTQLVGAVDNVSVNTASDVNLAFASTHGIRHLGTGRLNDAYGIAATVSTRPGSGPITTAYSLRAGQIASGGAIETGYGLYIDDIGATDAYGVYSVGSDDVNYFAGNVGVGTTTPGAKLEVAGQVKITGGTPGAGKVLTSDATGLASWQTPASGADNLGNHTATQNLNLATFKLVGNGGTSGVEVDASGNVGVGITPTEKFHVAGNVKVDNYLGIGVAPTAAWPLYVNGAALFTGITRGSSFQTVSTGSNVSPSMRYFNDPDTGIYFPVADNIAFTNAGNESLRIDVTGNVGIGTTTPGYKLDVQGGDINASGSVRAAGVALTSDRRWKKDIHLIENSIEKIQQLRGVSYVWDRENFPEKHFSEKEQIGVIAQEVLRVFPEAVLEDNEGFYSVNYPALVAPLIEATKEQQVQIEKNIAMFKIMQIEVLENSRKIASLELENEKIKEENLELTQRVNSLESENKMIKEFLCLKNPDAPFCHPM